MEMWESTGLFRHILLFGNVFRYLADEITKCLYCDLLTIQREATVNLLVSVIQVFRKGKKFSFSFYYNPCV